MMVRALGGTSARKITSEKPDRELIHLTQMCLSKQGILAESKLNISDALTWKRVMAEE